MPKRYLKQNVFDAAIERLHTIFSDFESVYVSFSGGKDSSGLVQLALQVAKERDRLPLPVLCIDLEAQYAHTVEFIRQIMNREDVDPMWVCLPLSLRNAVSQTQPQWICWNPEEKSQWVRPMPQEPGVISDKSYYPFFRYGMEFEEFIVDFGNWFAAKTGKRTAALVAIRSDESLNRFRTIASQTKTCWKTYQWTTKVSDAYYSAFPIYDWRTEDIWIAHGRNSWPYNKIYDLMNMAGVSIHAQRLCQPYGDDQRKGLWLFKILEPETWAKIVCRVEGANFGNRYALQTGNVLGNIKIELPAGHTWRSYAKFLLNTMPPDQALHYRTKILKFLNWWRKHRNELDGGRIPDFTDPKLEAARKKPSWRRICKVLLKNDYWCKGLSFTQTKRAMEKQLATVTKYMELL